MTISQSTQTYGYANVGRFGLAHSLLAWARCELWCRDHQAPILAPNWFQLRLGPYLRNERDKRSYYRFFRSPDHLHGVRRRYLLATVPRVIAEDVDTSALPPGSAPRILVFNNWPTGLESGHFREIIGRHVEVRSALERMTRPAYRASASASAFVGVHVRMGDFLGRVSVEELRQGKRSAQLPISWYVARLEELRERLGYAIPARIYSDGSDADLRELLALDRITRVEPGPAITEMLEMSHALVLITSGSGFGLWASYLGHVPRICHPGQRFMRVLGPPADVDLEPESDDLEPLPAAFAELLQNALRNSDQHTNT